MQWQYIFTKAMPEMGGNFGAMFCKRSINHVRHAGQHLIESMQAEARMSLGVSSFAAQSA